MIWKFSPQIALASQFSNLRFQFALTTSPNLTRVFSQVCGDSPFKVTCSQIKFTNPCLWKYVAFKSKDLIWQHLGVLKGLKRVSFTEV